MDRNYSHYRLTAFYSIGLPSYPTPPDKYCKGLTLRTILVALLDHMCNHTFGLSDGDVGPATKEFYYTAGYFCVNRQHVH